MCTARFGVGCTTLAASAASTSPLTVTPASAAMPSSSPSCSFEVVPGVAMMKSSSRGDRGLLHEFREVSVDEIGVIGGVRSAHRERIGVHPIPVVVVDLARMQAELLHRRVAEADACARR